MGSTKGLKTENRPAATLRMPPELAGIHWLSILDLRAGRKMAPPFPFIPTFSGTLVSP